MGATHPKTPASPHAGQIEAPSPQDSWARPPQAGGMLSWKAGGHHAVYTHCAL